jgi:hypothetical protein
VDVVVPGQALPVRATVRAPDNKGRPTLDALMALFDAAMEWHTPPGSSDDWWDSHCRKVRALADAVEYADKTRER